MACWVIKRKEPRETRRQASWKEKDRRRSVLQDSRPKNSKISRHSENSQRGRHSCQRKITDSKQDLCPKRPSQEKARVHFPCEGCKREGHDDETALRRCSWNSLANPAKIDAGASLSVLGNLVAPDEKAKNKHPKELSRATPLHRTRAVQEFTFGIFRHQRRGARDVQAKRYKGSRRGISFTMNHPKNNLIPNNILYFLV